MPVQDALQYSHPGLTVTSSGMSQQFVNASTSNGANFVRATSLLILNSTSGGAGATSYLDLTQGSSVLATTSASFPLKVGESVQISTQRGYLTGFSAIQASATTSTVLRVLAVRTV